MNFTLVTFWIFCNGHADSLRVKKQDGSKIGVPRSQGALKNPSRELAEQIGAVGRALAEGSWIKVSDTQQNDKSIIASTIFERD